MAEWIEIFVNRLNDIIIQSPLAMAEWIEIIESQERVLMEYVSASDGGVD